MGCNEIKCYRLAAMLLGSLNETCWRRPWEILRFFSQDGTLYAVQSAADYLWSF